MRLRQLYLGHFAALLAGSLIYILFRSKSLRMFGWFEEIGISKIVNSIRMSSNRLPNFVVYVLPDGLWTFSYISLILYLWKNNVQRHNFLWIFILPLIAIGSEIGQLIKIVPGTFDYADLIMYGLGAVLPFIIYKKSITNNLIQI